jgi:hypothetical protein
MRPDVGLIQALRAPFALNLKALQAAFGQNQLRLSAMADMEARRGAAPVSAWPVARVWAPSGMVLLLGLVLAGGMAAALLGSAAGELAMLGLLALLAVAGAFLVFGLLSGYLRVSERVAQAEIVKTVADGLEASRSSTAKAPYSIAITPCSVSRADALAGKRRSRNCSPASRIPHKVSSASTGPPSAASRERRSSTCARASAKRAQVAGYESACGHFLRPPAQSAV